MLRICFGIVAAVLTATLPISAAHATLPGQNGKIAFSGHLQGDTSWEIYTVNPDGTGLTRLTDAPGDDMDPSWSPDGTKLVFASQRDPALQTCDPTCTELYSMNADGTQQTRLTTTPDASELRPSWSPDGTQIAFAASRTTGGTDVMLMNPDGTGQQTLFTGSHDPTWSPTGSQLAVDRAGGVHVGNRDGSGLRFVDWGDRPDWSPYNDWILVRSGPSPTPTQLRALSVNGKHPSVLVARVSENWGRGHAWSPDMLRVAVAVNKELVLMRADGSDRSTLVATDSVVRGVDWLAIPAAVPGYPRPKSAASVRITLVPAYRECTAPDREHGPPLAFPSCSAPAQQSSSLTVGTPDANGEPSRFIGFFSLTGVPGNLATEEDEADVALVLVVTDVREQSDLTDFTGALAVPLDVRMTDKYNGGGPAGGPHAATSIDNWLADTLVFGAACAATSDPNVGATCSASTTLEAIVPGAVTEGVRAIWQLGQVQVYRYGAGEGPFAVQGIFVP